VGPHGGADGFADLLTVPRSRLARVRAVAVEEGALERPVAPEVLGREPSQVRVGGAQLGPAEVDHAEDPVVVQPVARLPVAVSGHQRRRRLGPGGDLVPQPLLDVRFDPVLAIEPADHLPVLAGLVGLVDDAGLVVQQGQQEAGLPVDVRLVGGRAALHQLPRQESGDHEQRLVVVMHQRGRPAA
jgi:hypothetical protein